MTVPWKAVDAPHGCVVVVDASGTDPTDDDAARWAEHLVASGCDALGTWVPATDALVRLEHGEVVEHLDRAAHGRLGLPQVVTGEWWNRFRSEVDDAGEAALSELPAQVIGHLGGQVGVLPTAHPPRR